jgi:predicted AlkP superfamily phosphohydrolase/phosphomutase/tetratricopeptide (TPR) repeat protein
MDRKVLLVGWDAADWKLIQPLMDAGLMPVTRRLVEGGVMANLLTLSPVLSPMLWTSIATGKRPFNHGILGFTEPMPGDKGVQPITNLSRSTKAIWNILCQNGKRCNVVGWWPSSPVEPIDGAMVSNHYQKSTGHDPADWQVAAGTLHPERLAGELADLRVHPTEITAEQILPFLPEGHRIDQQTDGRLEAVVKNIAECASIQNAATFLMEEEPWDFTAVYFDAIDHFCHGFMKYHPPRLEWIPEKDYEIYKNVVTAGYVFHDMMLGRLCELAGDEATVIIVSDHGFHPDHLRRKELPHEPAGPAAEHREHGVFIINGPGIRRDELIHGANLLDVTPTILSVFGLPTGDDMDGRALAEVFEAEHHIETLSSWDEVPGASGEHPAGMEQNADEAREAMEQLIALGYVERPSEDGAEAARKARQENQYNLAKSYIHAGMHGKALPILHELYRDNPLEFRFGIQAAICLQNLEYVDDLEQLVGDMRERWLKASALAKARLNEIAEIARERKKLQNEIRELRDAHEQQLELPEGAEKPRPLERIFSEKEYAVIKTLRAVARGNVAALDYMDGWVALCRGEHEQALQMLNAAEGSESGGAGYHYQLGETYRRLQRPDEAIEQFQKVLALDPHDWGAHLGLAQSHLASGNRSKAEELARASLALNYRLAPAHFVLGTCLRRDGQYSAARDCYEKALENNPNFPEVHEALAGLWREKLRNVETAARHEALAQELRREREERKETRLALDLPAYDEVDYPKELPEFPESHIVPRLGDAPMSERKEAAAGDASDTIYVVTGLPRSGTSMMMQMLRAAGIRPMTDNVREADENNPKGYLELERVKSLAQANDWLDDAHGQSLKVVSPMLPFLPQAKTYRVILMQRNADEIVVSQRQMLTRLDKSGGKLDDSALKNFLESQNAFAQDRLKAHSVHCLTLNYVDVVQQPQDYAAQVASFLGLTDEAAIDAMVAVVDASLHRERREAS